MLPSCYATLDKLAAQNLDGGVAPRDNPYFWMDDSCKFGVKILHCW